MTSAPPTAEASPSAERLLWENQARLRQFIHAADVGLWDWDLVTNAVYFSPEWKQQLGYAEHEFPNLFEEWERRLHPEDRERTLAAVRDYRGGLRAVYDVEFRMRHRDGSWRWIFSRADFLRDFTGKPVRMMGCHFDITERKLAEDAQRGLSHRLVQAGDAERRRIASELHDSTAQDLVAVLMNLGLLQDHLGSRDNIASQIIADSAALLENSIHEIRTLAYLAHPPRLDDSGLAGALAEYCNGFSLRTGIRVELETHAGFERLPEHLEMALFRVVQESLANVLRHSGSATATIRLAAADRRVTLEIADQGCGFSAAAHAGAAGVGIPGMRERMQYCGGRLEVESGSAGTTVRAVLPVPEGEA